MYIAHRVVAEHRERAASFLLEIVCVDQSSAGLIRCAIRKRPCQILILTVGVAEIIAPRVIGVI